MLLHVTRDRVGRRRLGEIAVLRQADSGLVQAVTAWHVDSGLTEHAGDLSRLLQSRMPT